MRCSPPRGVRIFVASEQLAALEENEFYWHELEGLAVRNLLGESLGWREIMETGANDVLLVEDECDGIELASNSLCGIK